MKYYPAFISLKHRRCVIIGGGEIAERKCETLLACDARVVVIAPHITTTLRAWSDAQRFEYYARSYQHGDLEGAFIVIAATDHAEVNAAVWREAEARQCLCNCVDDPPHCNFIVPSIVDRGDFKIAISTGGAAPAFASRIRQRLETQFGPEYGALTALFAELRDEIKAIPDSAIRKALWYELVDADLLAELRERSVDAAREKAFALIRKYIPSSRM